MQVFIQPFVPSTLKDKNGVTSTSNRAQCGRSRSSRSGHSLIERLISELSKQEFYVRCHILDSISIQLSNGKASCTIWFTSLRNNSQ